MKVSRHVVYSLLGSIIILYLFSLKDALLFLIGGIFIDTDHYLRFVAKFKKISLIKAYRYFVDGFNLAVKNPKKYYAIEYFHNIEFLVFIAILSFLFNIHFLFVGILMHLILDLLDAVRHKITCVREFSLIRYFLVRHKKQGLKKL